MRTSATYLSAAVLACAALAPANALAAGPEACGYIDFWAVSECHFEASGGCEASCEPLSFVAACDGACDASVDVSCEASCNVDCSASCEVNPGSFDCQASCNASCSAELEAHCGGDQECAAYYNASCDASCSADCNYVPPSASCEAKCEASCQASCEVGAELDCSLDCAAEIQGGCELDCQEPEGALFCDGQYIPVQDLPACLAYLASNLDIQVELEAEASANAVISCSLGEPQTAPGSLAAIMAGLALALGLRRGRRG